MVLSLQLPLANKLRKREYREIAGFQDSVVDVLYGTCPAAVMHGGTVVWRCFGGRRFSYDIDAYLPGNTSLKTLGGKFRKVAEDYGITVKKIKDTGNLMFVGLSLGDAYLKMEMNHATKKLSPVAIRFERTDGTFRDVLSLTANELIMEKIEAYEDRRFIRDIYDIYVLSDHSAKDTKLSQLVSHFLEGLPQPTNEGGDLETLLYEGPVPSFNNMVEHIRGKLL